MNPTLYSQEDLQVLNGLESLETVQSSYQLPCMLSTDTAENGIFDATMLQDGTLFVPPLAVNTGPCESTNLCLPDPTLKGVTELDFGWASSTESSLDRVNARQDEVQRFSGRHVVGTERGRYGRRSGRAAGESIDSMLHFIDKRYPSSRVKKTESRSRRGHPCALSPDMLDLTKEASSSYVADSFVSNKVTVPFEKNRKKCTRSKAMHGNHHSPKNITQDHQRPYTCTSGCGAKFKTKDSWRRHEEINFPQQLWLCRKEPCISKPKKFVSLRPDHFANHLRKQHGYTEVSNDELENSFLPIKSKFNKQCILRSCDIILRTWKQRINHIAKELEKPWDITDWRELTSSRSEPSELSSDGQTKSSSSSSSNADTSPDNPGAAPAPGNGSGPSDGPDSGPGLWPNDCEFGQLNQFNPWNGGYGGSMYGDNGNSQWQDMHHESNHGMTALIPTITALAIRTYLPKESESVVADGPWETSTGKETSAR